LYEKNKVFKVICAGSGAKDREICTQFGAEWVDVPNQPLGHKWNEAFAAAEKYNPDACLFIGSSDWLEDKWLDYMEQYIADYDLIGTPDHYMCDERHGKIRVAYWELYPNSTKRAGEAVGGGRILTKRLLGLMKWRPFDASWDHSMDYSMTQHAIRVGAKQLLLDGHTLMVLAMSSDKWQNKHSLDRELLAGRAVVWDSGRGIEYLAEHFPEALTLYDDNKRDFYQDINTSFPNTAEKNKSYTDWRLPNITLYPTRFCSHGCWYCCSEASKVTERLSIVDEMGVDSYINAVLSLAGDKKVEYRFSGGEPLQHKDTPYIIEKLIKAGHEICLGTNGVHIKTVAPVLEKHKKKVRYEASFHLGQYLLKESRAESYLKTSLPTMLKHCREMELVIPLTPLLLSSNHTHLYLSRAAEIINSYGFNSRDVFNLTELGGVFEGRNFPAEYTQEEKDAIAELHNLYGKENFNTAEVESETKLNRKLKLATVPCFNMTRLFQVGDDGRIWVCGAGVPENVVGNLQDPDIASKIDIRDTPKPCGFLECVCPYLALKDCLNPRGMDFTSYNELKEKHGV
jgi:hypothetical protein